MAELISARTSIALPRISPRDRTIFTRWGIELTTALRLSDNVDISAAVQLYFHGNSGSVTSQRFGRSVADRQPLYTCARTRGGKFAIKGDVRLPVTEKRLVSRLRNRANSWREKITGR